MTALNLRMPLYFREQWVCHEGFGHDSGRSPETTPSHRAACAFLGSVSSCPVQVRRKPGTLGEIGRRKSVSQCRGEQARS